MIKSFKCKETEKVFNRTYSKNWSKEIQNMAFRKLRMLNNSIRLTDLKIPQSNRLEKLKGNRKGQYSIRINDQWRICFTWQHPDAYNVEIVDYH